MLKTIFHKITDDPFRKLVAWMTVAIMVTVTLGVFYSAKNFGTSNPEVAFAVAIVAIAFAIFAPAATVSLTFLATYSVAIFALAGLAAFIVSIVAAYGNAVFFTAVPFATIIPVLALVSTLIAFVCLIAAYVDVAYKLKLQCTTVLVCLMITVGSTATGLLIPMPWGVVVTDIGVLALVVIAYKYSSARVQSTTPAASVAS